MSAHPDCALRDRPHRAHDLTAAAGVKLGVRCDGNPWPEPEFEGGHDLSLALAEHQAHAMDNLHEVQRAIKPGDHWVRFVDLDSSPPVVEFGYVLTPEEIALNMLDDGIQWEAVVGQIEERDRRLAEVGMAWGTVSSVVEQGALRETHISEVWPIDRSLYDWALMRSWDVTKVEADKTAFMVLPPEVLDLDAGRALLQIAFAGIRAHYLPKYDTNKEQS